VAVNESDCDTRRAAVGRVARRKSDGRRPLLRESKGKLEIAVERELLSQSLVELAAVGGVFIGVNELVVLEGHENPKLCLPGRGVPEDWLSAL
jgi:hypothetical protein